MQQQTMAQRMCDIYIYTCLVKLFICTVDMKPVPWLNPTDQRNFERLIFATKHPRNELLPETWQDKMSDDAWNDPNISQAAWKAALLYVHEQFDKRLRSYSKETGWYRKDGVKYEKSGSEIEDLERGLHIGNDAWLQSASVGDLKSEVEDVIRRQDDFELAEAEKSGRDRREEVDNLRARAKSLDSKK